MFHAFQSSADLFFKINRKIISGIPLEYLDQARRFIGSDLRTVLQKVSADNTRAQRIKSGQAHEISIRMAYAQMS